LRYEPTAHTPVSKKKSCLKKLSSKEISCQGEKAMHKQMKLLYIQVNHKQRYLCEMFKTSAPLKQKDSLNSKNM
jgi:hypothetical protein